MLYLLYFYGLLKMYTGCWKCLERPFYLKWLEAKHDIYYNVILWFSHYFHYMLLNIISIVLFGFILRYIPNKIPMFIYNYWTVPTFARVFFFKWNFKLVPTYSKEIPLKWCVIYHRTPQKLFQHPPQNVPYQL